MCECSLGLLSLFPLLGLAGRGFPHLLIQIIIVVLLLHLECPLELDDLVLKVPALCFHPLQSLLVVVDGLVVLRFPLLDNAFLHPHDLEGFLLTEFGALSGFEELILQLREFQVAFIVQLVDAVVVEGLKASHL